MAATLVQSRVLGPNTDPFAGAFTSNVTSGTYLYALSVESTAGSAVTGITDSRSNTWASVAAADTPTYRVELWKAPSGSSGACTVTVDFGSMPASNGLLALLEFSGMGIPTNGASNTLDQSVAADPMPCATLSVTGAGVIFCGVRLDGAHTLTSWGNSFNDLGSGIRARAAYRIVTGAVSAAPTMDCSTTETGESLTVVVYDQVIGGSGFRSRLAGGLVMTG
jgi:hypothetical protein